MHRCIPHVAGKAGCARPFRVDAALLRSELLKAIKFRDTHHVPVLLDQWGVSRDSGAGREVYAADLLRACDELSIPWVYWNGRQLASRSSGAEGGVTFGLLKLHREQGGVQESVRLDWDTAMLSELQPYLGAGPRRSDPIQLSPS
jgi:hypothetical protein